jgi:hypothetical protein
MRDSMHQQNQMCETGTAVNVAHSLPAHAAERHFHRTDHKSRPCV